MWLSTSIGRIVMIEGSMYRQLGPDTFANLERKIAAKQYVGPGELARILRANTGQPIPDKVLDYVCKHLEGSVKKPRGRKPRDAAGKLRVALVKVEYVRYLQWLQDRKRRHGLRGWSCIRDADWWDGPPYERAARLLTRKYFRNRDWKHVRNLVSSDN